MSLTAFLSFLFYGIFWGLFVLVFIYRSGGIHSEPICSSAFGVGKTVMPLSLGLIVMGCMFLESPSRFSIFIGV
jgi:hypothetical protein